MIGVALVLGVAAGGLAGLVARNWLAVTAGLDAALSPDIERTINDTATSVALVVGLIVWSIVLAIAGAANQVSRAMGEREDIRSFRLSRRRSQRELSSEQPPPTTTQTNP